MNAEAQAWFAYADENLAVARWALESGYFNACLQNVQQAVEKYLKAILISQEGCFQKTHSVAALNLCLTQAGVSTALPDEDCELLDTIYIPSKYPTQSVLADFIPDQAISQRCITIAQNVRAQLHPYLSVPRLCPPELR